MYKDTLLNDCHVSALEIRMKIHILLFMHKQSKNEDLLKQANIATRLHQAPVFKIYKPNNEKARQNILYRGALEWNVLPSKDRNSDFKVFKSQLIQDQFIQF